MYVTLSPDHHPAAKLLDESIQTKTRLSPELCLKAGTHLFHEGDEVTRIYEVTQGVLRLTRLLEDGRRQVIAFGYPGDIVGFPADGLYHTDCEALTPVRLKSHKAAALDNPGLNPALNRKLVSAALEEIGAMQDHFMMLGRKSATEKIASFLMSLDERVGEPLGVYTQVSLPMCRADIADFLGLRTETVSRTFAQLRKCRIIAIDNIYTVIIIEPEKLEAIANGCAI